MSTTAKKRRTTQSSPSKKESSINAVQIESVPNAPSASGSHNFNSQTHLVKDKANESSPTARASSITGQQFDSFDVSESMSNSSTIQPPATDGADTDVNPTSGGNGRNMKNLSCQRCRVRKVKCDFEYPCSSCVKVGAYCVRVTNDMRKKRPRANYVTSLEKKITSLTKFYETFNQIESIEEKQKYLEQNELESILARDDATEASSIAYHQHHEIPGDTYINPVYGPTSVYDTGLADRAPISNKKKGKSSLHTLNKDPDILHCIKLFFKWQYPDHNMFIFRESFLTDFFDPKPNSQYCSRVLVLSICALGSRMSDSDDIYNRSIQFYNEAKSSLLSRLDHPSIPSLQSFLLLAFYDICNGSNSSGWMLSGNAMRMGFDLGFQLNPEVWFLKDQHNTNTLDIPIRSRIYWGAYMADHFISLVLGRPSLLKMSDASIPETDNLPDLEWIDEFRFISPSEVRNEKGMPSSNISDPLKSVINLINISDNVLNDIFTKTENDQVDKNHNIEEVNLESRLENLLSYNMQIKKWKANLPKDLNWDRENLKFMGDNPTLACVKYYYYILVLCLNRPFVGIVKEFGDRDQLSPSVMCNETMEDLLVALKRFKEVHGLRRASVFIVYCCILSISVILLSSSTDLTPENKERLEFFMEILSGCSRTWKLASKSYNLIKLKLEHSYGSDVIDINEEDSKKKKEGSIKSSKTGAPKKRKHSATKIKPVAAPRPVHSNSTDASGNFVDKSGSDNHGIVSSGPVDSTNEAPVTHSLTQSHDGTQTFNSDGMYATKLPGTSAQTNVSESPQNDTSLFQNLNTEGRATNGTSEQFSASTNSPGQSVISNGSQLENRDIMDANTELLFDGNLEFFGGPPVLMTSDLFNEDWGSLFPDYNFNTKS